MLIEAAWKRVPVSANRPPALSASPNAAAHDIRHIIPLYAVACSAGTCTQKSQDAFNARPISLLAGRFVGLQQCESNAREAGIETRILLAEALRDVGQKIVSASPGVGEEGRVAGGSVALEKEEYNAC